MTSINYTKYLPDLNKLPVNVSKIDVTLKDNLLTITFNRVRKNALDTTAINLRHTLPNRQYVTNITVKSSFYKDKVLFMKEDKKTGEVLVVYTEGDMIMYYRHDNPDTHPLTRLIIVKSKIVLLTLTKRSLWFFYACFVDNKYNIPITASYLTVGNDIKRQKRYPIFKGFPSKLAIFKKSIFNDTIPLKALLEGEPSINEPIRVSLDIDGMMAHHTLTKGSKRIKSPKWYYAPLTQTRRRGYAVSIRRTPNAGVVLVRRRLEEIERTAFFKFIESKFISYLMYHSAHMVRRTSSRKVNIYFEKNANQAEEGALDIFRKARENSRTANYFIINRESKDYPDLEDERNVVKNFTLKSYWLIYRANSVIATEVPQHVNILRSGNKYIRLAPFSQKFVFLQHGIIYLKSLSKTTSFSSGREGEPDYMVVSSKKERDIVSDLLGIDEERQLNVGLLAFDKVKYGHITNQSRNIATIMLTWRSYEEHLQDFSKSSYYQMVKEIYAVMKPLLGEENIRIVAHPKFRKLLASTSMADAVWDGAISDVLEETKLLITDYSSVCYNVFYRGGGVVFYQPDLERYEQHEGKLIPEDGELVGHRALTRADLTALMNERIQDKIIDLDSFRGKKFVSNYESINEHRDGGNVNRLYDELSRIKIL